MRAAIVSFVSVLAFAASAFAQAENERLVIPPFPGNPAWKEASSQAQRGHWRREFIPGDQKLSNYQDILAVEAYPDLRTANPGEFIKGIFGRVAGACDGVRVNGPVERTEGGFAVAYAQIYCGRQKGERFGVNIFYKVIQGKDALYVINRDVRVKPQPIGGVQSFTKDQMQEMVAVLQRQGMANKYLGEQVYLCGGTSTDERCKNPPPPLTPPPPPTAPQ